MLGTARTGLRVVGLLEVQVALAPVDGASAPSEFRVRASGTVPDIPLSRFALVQAALRSGTGVDPYATSSALTDREVALSWSSWKSS